MHTVQLLQKLNHVFCLHSKEEIFHTIAPIKQQEQLFCTCQRWTRYRFKHRHSGHWHCSPGMLAFGSARTGGFTSAIWTRLDSAVSEVSLKTRHLCYTSRLKYSVPDSRWRKDEMTYRWRTDDPVSRSVPLQRRAECGWHPSWGPPSVNALLRAQSGHFCWCKNRKREENMK